MRASPLTASFPTIVSPDAGLKDARKSAATSPSSTPTFQHALNHAQKTTKTVDVKAKVEKPKTNKGDKSKPAKNASTSAGPNKKGVKANSSDDEDSEQQDDSADSSSEQDSSPHEKPTSPQAENAASKDAANNDDGAGATDEADISDSARQAAADASSTAKSSAVAATQPATGQKSAKKDPSATTVANTNAKTAAVSPDAVQPVNAIRSSKSKAQTSVPTAAGINRGKNADATAIGTRASDADALTTAPGHPAADELTSVRTAKGEPSTAQAIGQTSSSDDSVPDPDVDPSSAAAAASALPAAPDGSTEIRATAPAPAAAAAIGQSSFATFAQSLADASAASASSTTAGTGIAVRTAGNTASSTSNPSANAGAKFVAENHPSIVQSVKTQLLPSGGTMRLRLDPPEIGALQVSVHVKDGVVNASFETSSDQATKMLSHSLGQLKQALESQGVTVGTIHVQQSAKNESTGDRPTDGESDFSQSKENTSSSQQDEQRRETLRRMWERLSIGGDPLDLVA